MNKPFQFKGKCLSPSFLVKQLSFLLLLLCSTFWVEAQQLAFPGAEGGGRFATGGRGGTVYEVTNLNDAGTGSLRDAVSVGNRTIIFKVSGEIKLKSRLSIKQNNITIAGQTAPGDGICVTGYTLNISASNIILRYIRCRFGDDNAVDDDAMNCWNGAYQNIIIDHCSMSWSIDETATFYGIRNFTLQWCIISESLFRSKHDKGDHGYAGIWGGANATFHHNLVAHHTSRNPRFGGTRTGYIPYPAADELVDYRNNVIYNWGNINSSYGGEGAKINMVNNYYKPGPATPGSLTTSSASNKRNRILNYSSYYAEAGVDTLFGGKFYIAGNVVAGYPDIATDNWAKGVQKDSYAKADALIAANKQSQAFTMVSPIRTQTAEDAYLTVLDSAGAILPRRDLVDNRIVNETKTGTATYEGAAYASVTGTGISHPSGIIDSPANVGGIPSYGSNTAYADADKDGMPDAYETAKGLNPANASDGNLVASNGYTNLENYLNSITADTGSGKIVGSSNVPTITITGTVSDFLQTVGTPSGSQVYTISATNLTSNLIITPPANFEISSDAGKTWVNSTKTIALTPVSGTVASMTIQVRANASAVGSYKGTITHASTDATTQSVFLNAVTQSQGAASATPKTLAYWSLAVSNQDSLEIRAAGVNTSTPVGRRLSVSDGAALPAYSTAHGMAVAPSADGFWTAAKGGNSNNLSRAISQQFVIKAKTGFSLRVDSLAMKSALFAAASGKIAIVYSKTGFKSDSAECTGGIMPDGSLITSAANGSFAAPFLPLNESAETVSQYRLALKGSEGIALAAGDSLTVRFYFSTGSTSAGRYAKIKNLEFKGTSTATAVINPSVTVSTTLQDFNAVVGRNSAVQTFTFNADNLTGDLSITAPANFEISRDGTTWVTSSTPIVVKPVNGTILATTLSVRSASSVSTAGTYTGNISFTSTGLTTVNVATKVIVAATATPKVTVTQSLKTFANVVGQVAPIQTYSVAGADLTADLIITPSGNFEVSKDGTTWFTAASPLKLTATAGTLANTTISVRLNTQTVGTYSGTISNASTGATTTSINVLGAVTAIDLSSFKAIVALDGSGTHKTVQAAIDAAPTNSTTPYRIYIKNGKYLEKVNIASNKTFIHLIGESAAKTIISWNDYSGKIVAGVTIGTSTSVTLAVKANDCFLSNLTVENSTGDAPQAVAISFEADRDVAKGCIFLGGQDTFLANGDGKRQYLKNCYIDGVVDFIFGSSTAVFDSCIVYAKDRGDKLAGSYITAANTPNNQAYGYVFRNCILPSNTGVTSYVLGRPWQNDASTADAAKKYNKVAFINSTFGDKIVKPEGWSTWDAGTNTALITYAEYKNKKFNGTLAPTNSRVAWSKQLTDAEVIAYNNNATVFGTWDPCTTTSDFCKTPQAELALVNIKVTKGANLTVPTNFAWNIAWAMKDVKFELYRSTDNKASYSVVKTITAATDTLINYSTTDDAPLANKNYFYVIKASKNGFTSFLSDTISVSSIPTITIVGTPKDFVQGLGTPSAAQAYTLTAVNLADNVTINVPTNFEISADGGKTWNNSQKALTITPTSGSITTTTMQVRLNATTAGTYTGTISHTSTGAVSKNIATNGTTQTTALVAPKTLAFWSMAVANTDSVALRAKGVTPTTPSLKRMAISNGSVIAAYSSLHGQCIAPSLDGGGLWTAAAGGNGNNLHRGIYEQFVIKAQTGYSVKVDSLLLKNSLYQAATGKLAIVYSKTGFKSDSSDVSGGLLPDRTPMLASANGGFNTPVILASDPAATTTLFQISLKGSDGIQLAAGDSLTVRLYFSTGSGSPGRYAKIKDLQFKGTTKDLLAKAPVLTITQSLKDFSSLTGQASAVQTYTLTAANLTNDLSITAPTGFEISSNGTTWSNSSSPLKITPASGSIASATISVRAAASISTAGTYSGNIVHSSDGLDAQTIAVKVVTTVPVPVLNVTQSIKDFANVVGQTIGVQTFTVAGENLGSDLTITAPANYELSLNGTTWSAATSPIKLTATAGKVATTTVSIRLASQVVGTYTGNLTIAATGVTTVSVPLTGKVTMPTLTVSSTMTDFAVTLGLAVSKQTYTVAGKDLIADVIVTPPTNFEISLDGTSWLGSTSSLKLSQTAGVLAQTTISVRPTSTVAGTYSGVISHTTTAGTTATLNLKAVVIAPLATEKEIDASSIVVSPNPAQTTIKVSHPTGTGTLSILGVSGISLKSQAISKGTENTTIDISTLPTGMYLVEYQNDSVRTVVKIIKN